MLTDDTIREIVQRAQAEGSPLNIAMRLEAALYNVKFQHDKAMREHRRRAEVLAMVARCAGNVAAAAERLEVTPRAVYHHLEAEQKLKGQPATTSQDR